MQNLVSVSTTDLTGSDRLLVACQLGNRIWEGVVANGSIISEEVRFVRGKLASSPPSMVCRQS